MIADIKPGYSFMAMHFTRPGDISAMDLRFHQLRTEEYRLFRSEAFRARQIDPPAT